MDEKQENKDIQNTEMQEKDNEKLGEIKNEKVDELFDNSDEDEKTKKRGRGKHSR